ncbi:MAG: response regulator [Patescibacteria group bacterium]|jgi:DNA-binding response OmpR family regulator
MKTTNVMKSKKGRILLVEDESQLVDIYHDFLEMNGYDFLSTNNIQEALQLTEFEQPDLVLLDIIIPKPENTIAEQGWEYLAAVKKNSQTKDIPIVVFTNLETHRDRVKSEKMGAAAYIFKRDCTPREVMETIAEIIKKDRERKKK